MINENKVANLAHGDKGSEVNEYYFREALDMLKGTANISNEFCFMVLKATITSNMDAASEIYQMN